MTKDQTFLWKKNKETPFYWRSMLSFECMNGLVLDDLNNRMFFQIQQLIRDGEKTISC